MLYQGNNFVNKNVWQNENSSCWEWQKFFIKSKLDSRRLITHLSFTNLFTMLSRFPLGKQLDQIFGNCRTVTFRLFNRRYGASISRFSARTSKALLEATRWTFKYFKQKTANIIFARIFYEIYLAYRSL